MNEREELEFYRQLDAAEKRKSQKQSTHELPKKPSFSGLKGFGKGYMQAQVDMPLAMTEAVSRTKRLPKIPGILSVPAAVSAMVSKPVADAVKPTLESAHQYWQPSSREELPGFFAGKVGGSVASLPGMAAAKVPIAASIAGKMATGGGTATAFGTMAQPVPNAKDMSDEEYGAAVGKQGLVSGVGGLAIPAGWELVKGIGRATRDVTRSFSDSGREKLYSDYLKYLLEKNPGAKDKIIAELRKQGSPIEGYDRTAGQQLAHMPEATALISAEKHVAKSPGYGAPKFGERWQQQGQALRNKFDEGVGSLDDLAALETQRKNVPYPVDMETRTIPVAGELADILHTPIGRRGRDAAVQRVINRREGMLPTDEAVTLGNMQAMREELGDIAGDPKAFGMTGAKARDIIDIRQQLGDFMPDDWKAANQQYADVSKKISQVEVGQQLKNKLFPIAGNVDEAMANQKDLEFLAAMRNWGSESGTLPSLMNRLGEMRYKSMDKLMTPTQMKALNEITEEVTRKTLYKNPLQSADLSMAERVQSQGKAVLPSMFSRPVVVTNWMLEKFGKSIADEINAIGAQFHLDPVLLAAKISDKTPTQAMQYLNNVKTYMTNPAVGALGSEPVPGFLGKGDSLTAGSPIGVVPVIGAGYAGSAIKNFIGGLLPKDQAGRN